MKTEQNIGFWQDRNGDYSMSRLIGFILICAGLVIAMSFVPLKIMYPKFDLMQTATAIGTVFAAIAGPALTFMFFQKRTESKNDLLTSPPTPETK